MALNELSELCTLKLDYLSIAAPSRMLHEHPTCTSVWHAVRFDTDKCVLRAALRYQSRTGGSRYYRDKVEEMMQMSRKVIAAPSLASADFRNWLVSNASDRGL